MGYEVVYKGRDNTNDFQLTADGNIVDLSAVTRMVLDFGTFTIDSAFAPTAFDWSKGNGEVDLRLGPVEALILGEKQFPYLIVYDPSNLNGINWGTIPMNVI